MAWLIEGISPTEIFEQHMCDKRAQATPLHLDPWLGDAMKNINNADIFGLANRSRYQNIRTEAARFASGANINLWSWEPTSQQAAAPHNAETGANISGIIGAPIKPTLRSWVFARNITIPSGRTAPTNAQYEISAAATKREGVIDNFFFSCRCRCRCLPCRKIFSGSKTK